MKTLTAFLLASGLAILNALSVSAQEQTPTIPQTGFPMPTMATCDTSEKMVDVIYNKYGEQPLANGKGSIFAANGQMLVGTMTYWINAETEQQAKELLASNCYDTECYFLDEKIQSVVLEAEGVEDE